MILTVDPQHLSAVIIIIALFQERGPFRPYLHIIGMNACLTQKRKQPYTLGIIA